MRDKFKEYYSPSEEEYKALWHDGIIVFDTNVLLDLYRLPQSARDQFIDLMDLLRDRLWLPHQVALEFQRRRLTVISNERTTTEQVLRKSQELHDSVVAAVEKLEIEKRGLGIETNPLIQSFTDSKTALIEAIEKTHNSLADISSSDPVRDRIDAIIGTQIGPSPQSQQELDELIKDGEFRYENGIPPGYKDANKEKDPKTAEFRYDGMSYQSQYGDLILWRQILNHLKTIKGAKLLFVTSDQKEDWWWKEKGKTVGPRPELIREIYKEAKVDAFWMYSSDQFLNHAKEHTQANISEESVNELQEVVRLSGMRGQELSPSITHDLLSRYVRETNSVRYNPSKIRMIEHQVAHRLGIRDSDAEFGSGFPDIVAHSDDGKRVGYEIKVLSKFNGFKISPPAINAMLRGYLEINEGKLEEFYLVLVVPVGEMEVYLSEYGHSHLRNRTGNLLERYPITGLVFATYDDDEDSFVEIYDIVRP